VFVSGIAAALAASVLFNAGIVLEALDARVAPRSLRLRLSLLKRLFGRPRWVLGWLLSVAGILPQLRAYATAPFVVVQPLLVVGLVLVLFCGERVLHERVGVREAIGVSAIIGGVALVAWGAPHHSEAHRGGVAVIAVVAGLAFSGLVPFLIRGTRFDVGMLTVVAAGCGFGAANVAAKLVGDDFNVRHYADAAGWAIVGLLMAVAATVTMMTAFQRCAATTVVPISTAVQTFLPIVLEPFFLREHWGSATLDGVPVILGLVVALIGSVRVSESRQVSELIAGAQDGKSSTHR
jgi:drug/metabolite transporter (DMT)-like permease